MKVQGPVLSMEAHGGLGLWNIYKKRPPLFYPIALYPCFFYPYARVLKPWYDSDPSIYQKFRDDAPFHYYGWYYQLRRTWHGIVWAAIRYTNHSDLKTSKQLKQRGYFSDGLSVWNSMSDETKDLYKKMRYPIYATGFNRFLHYYLREHS